MMGLRRRNRSDFHCHSITLSSLSSLSFVSRIGDETAWNADYRMEAHEKAHENAHEKAHEKSHDVSTKNCARYLAGAFFRAQVVRFFARGQVAIVSEPIRRSL